VCETPMSGYVCPQRSSQVGRSLKSCRGSCLDGLGQPRSFVIPIKRRNFFLKGSSMPGQFRCPGNPVRFFDERPDRWDALKNQAVLGIVLLAMYCVCNSPARSEKRPCLAVRYLYPVEIFLNPLMVASLKIWGTSVPAPRRPF